MKAIFPCSFDPIHNGHIEVIKDASEQYEHLYLFVANNETKKYQNTLTTRRDIVLLAIQDLGLKNVEVRTQEPGTFIPMIAKELGVEVIVRGIASKLMPRYEEDLMESYMDMNSDLYFNYIITPTLKVTSEDIIKLKNANKSIKEFVPSQIEKEVILKWQ